MVGELMNIEWNGHVVGHLEDVEAETVGFPPTSKLRGRWVSHGTAEAHEFTRRGEAQFHLEVQIGGVEPVRGQRILFSFGMEGEAWLLFHVYDMDEFWRAAVAKGSE